MEITCIDLYRQFNLRRNICIIWPEWANKLRLEVAKLPPFIKNFKRVPAFSPLFGDQKHFAFLYFKWTEVIPFDYAGYRNLYKHGVVVVFANALNLTNAFVAGLFTVA